MYWEILVVVFVLWGLRAAWRTYTHPAYVLGRQAANMNWVAAGQVEDDKGFKNVKYTREGIEAVVSFADHEVFLVRPQHNGRFADFVALERWLAEQANGSDTGAHIGAPGPRMPEPQSTEDIDISNFHPALDAAVEWTIESLITGGLTDKGCTDPQLAITAEIMVFTATCRARLEGSTDIHRMVWNSFKSGVENRIIEHVEEKPPRSDVIETAHSTTYVSLTTRYYVVLDDIEEVLESSQPAALGEIPVRILQIFQEQLEFGTAVENFDVEVLMMNLQEFAWQQILPRVARLL